MPRTLAKHAEPAILKPNQVRERIVRRLVPDLSDFQEPGRFLSVRQPTADEHQSEHHRTIHAVTSDVV